MSAKLKALLATGRVSNLPTVWCNCIAASLILIHHLNVAGFSWNLQLTQLTILLIITSSFFYVGGCFMGDYNDSEFDAKHKPDRPVPAGILSKKSLLLIGLPLMMLAFAGALIIPKVLFATTLMTNFLPVLFLSYCIQHYSRYHKRSLFIGLPLIGLCRFFLIIFAAATTSIFIHYSPFMELNKMSLRISPYLILPIILYAAAVCIYTIAFASVARTESSDSPITWRNILRYTMLALPLMVLITNQQFQLTTAIALIIYAYWLTYAFSFLSKNKGKYVSKCLAGFCLLDACFVAQFGWQWLVICLILFLLSLALQRSVPAT
jgi:4-hydroxybenzoate polyprenyltransferase